MYALSKNVDTCKKNMTAIQQLWFYRTVATAEVAPHPGTSSSTKRASLAKERSCMIYSVLYIFHVAVLCTLGYF